jgi:hypothetical protein
MQHMQDVIAQGNCPSFGTRCPAAGSKAVTGRRGATPGSGRHPAVGCWYPSLERASARRP